MKIITANGRQVPVREDEDGYVDINELRRDIGFGTSRALIVQRPNGSNEILPASGRLLLKPEEAFTDAPIADRGR